MPAGGSLAFGYNLERADDLDRGLEREGKRFTGLRYLSRENALEVASAISKDDKDDLLLITQTVHPAGCTDTF